MKYLLTLLFFFIFTQLKAQNGDMEIKVVSKTNGKVIGQLKKVNVEGIGIENEKGEYLVFRPAEIKRIKIRKRGLTILQGLGGGTLIGLGLSGGILSLDDEGKSTNDLLMLSAVLTGSGAVAGTITGAVAQIANTKLTLRVNGSESKFKSDFKLLEPYINTSKPAEKFTYRAN